MNSRNEIGREFRSLRRQPNKCGGKVVIYDQEMKFDQCRIPTTTANARVMANMH